MRTTPSPVHPQAAATTDGTPSRRGLITWLFAVRVPLQHGVFGLSIIAGAVLGAMLASIGGDQADLLPAWLPALPGDALLAGSLLGATVAGSSAWLLCRPRRAQRWTIDYAGQRLIGLRGPVPQR